MQREKEKRDRGRERKVDIFALFSPSDEVLKWSVYGEEKACSIAVTPLVSKILGDKRFVHMGLCIKANEHIQTSVCVCVRGYLCVWSGSKLRWPQSSRQLLELCIKSTACLHAI